MPSWDGGTGNREGEGEIGVGLAVVVTALLVGDVVVIVARPVVAMVSASTLHLAEEKSGTGTKAGFVASGTLDFNLSMASPLDTGDE
jgi:hypothetical protein